MAAHPVITIIIILVLIAIFLLVGLMSYYSMTLGLIVGKLSDFWHGVQTVIEHLDGGDISDYIHSSDVKALAQYMQDMGYDIESYGLGDVTYEEQSDEAQEKGESKKIKSVNADTGGRQYLYIYLVADKATTMQRDAEDILKHFNLIRWAANRN